jgi:hypothetical protein
VKAGALVERAVAPKTISLKDLARPPQKRSPDLAGLKDALKNALGGKNAAPKEEAKNGWKPGEAIKL